MDTGNIVSVNIGTDLTAGVCIDPGRDLLIAFRDILPLLCDPGRIQVQKLPQGLGNIYLL